MNEFGTRVLNCMQSIVHSLKGDNFRYLKGLQISSKEMYYIFVRLCAIQKIPRWHRIESFNFSVCKY